MAKIIKFNGIDIKSPSDYTVSRQDIRKAERNAACKMLIEQKATKWKLELSWNYISQVEANEIVSILESTVFYEVEFYDLKGTRRKATFYAGDQSAGLYDFKNGKLRWKEFKFNIIEQ